MIRTFIIIATLFSPLTFASGDNSGSRPLELQDKDLPHFISIAMGKTAVSFRVAIADSRVKRSKGLQHITYMPPYGGMLFVYPYDTFATFWMKDTPMALDILFIDKTGKIRHIHPNAQPYDTTFIQSKYRVRYVLEILGGTSHKLKIRAGHVIKLPAEQFLRAVD